MDYVTLFKIALILGSLLLVSKQILHLSLSMLASTAALVVSVVGVLISLLLVIIMTIPTALIGCVAADRVQNGKYMTGVVADICKSKNSHTKTHTNIIPPINSRKY